MTPKQTYEISREILAGKMCPYCGAETEFVDSKEVYGTGMSYGMVYLCRPCAAYVGVHRGTNKALGRLANVELRRLKMEAHKVFDPLWERKMRQGFSLAFQIQRSSSASKGQPSRRFKRSAGRRLSARRALLDEAQSANGVVLESSRCICWASCQGHQINQPKNPEPASGGG